MAADRRPARRRRRRSASPCWAARWRPRAGAGGAGAAVARRARSSARASRSPRSLVALPLSGARYAWGRDYGIVTQAVPGWLLDLGKGLGVRWSSAGSSGRGVAVAIARAAARVVGGRSPRASAALVYAMSLLSPLRARAALPADRAAARPGASSAQILELADRAGRAGRRRQGQRRQHAHDRGQRLRVGARRQPPHRPLRHAAARLPRATRCGWWSPTSWPTSSGATC